MKKCHSRFETEANSKYLRNKQVSLESENQKRREEKDQHH